MADQKAGYPGMMSVWSGNSDFHATSFLVRMLQGKMQTATLVKVLKVNGPTEEDPSLEPSVDVQPLVAQVDGQGNETPHGTVFALPFMRLQGGTNAVIIDPAVDDIGIAVFASRDISAVKADKAPAPPGSARQFDMADGMYIGGILNGVPQQLVSFLPDGIHITTPQAVFVVAQSATFTGVEGGVCSVTIDGTLSVGGAVSGDAGADFANDVTGAGISLENHVHGGVQSGGASTDPPS